MHRSHNYLAGLTARRGGPDTVQVTLVRIDPASHRMVFEEIALICADPASPVEIAHCLLMAAGKLMERANPQQERLSRAPQGG